MTQAATAKVSHRRFVIAILLAAFLIGLEGVRVVRGDRALIELVQGR